MLYYTQIISHYFSNMLKKLRKKGIAAIELIEKWVKTDVRYIIKGGFWLSLNRIFLAITTLLISVTFANLMTRADYGVYKYVTTIITLLVISSLPGMKIAINQAVARGYEGSLIPAMKTKIKWGAFGTLVGIIISLYYYLNGNDQLALLIAAVSLVIPFKRSFQVYVPFFSGKKNFKQTAIFSLIQVSITTIITIITLFLTKNLLVILLAIIIPPIIIDLIFFRYTLKKQENDKADPDTTRYGLFLSLMNAFTTLADNIDKLLLWFFLGPIQLAVYSFALSPINQLSTLATSEIPSLALPKLSTKDIGEIKKSLPLKVFKFSLLLLPVVVLYIILAPWLYGIIFPQYPDSVIYSQILSLMILIQPGEILFTALKSQKKKKEIQNTVIFSALIRIALFITLLPTLGILGLVIAQLLGMISRQLFIYFQLRRV